MDYTTLIPPAVTLSEEALNMLVPARSLYETMQHLPDPRREQGKRYPLALVLCLLLLAKLAGQTSLSGATDWIRHRAEQIAEHFGLSRKKMPCQMTYCRILARIDVKLLDDLLAAFFTRWEAKPRCGTEPSRLHTQAGKLDHVQLAHSWQNCACHQ